MTKYQEYFKKMLDENPEVFTSFREMHDLYLKDSSLQEKYNEVGKPIISLIRDYEDKLCNHSEGSGYAAYSGKLAEKFWDEVRKEFPMIDRVGVIIKKAPVAVANMTVVEEVVNDGGEEFELKKIEMFELKRIKLV